MGENALERTLGCLVDRQMYFSALITIIWVMIVKIFVIRPNPYQIIQKLCRHIRECFKNFERRPIYLFKRVIKFAKVFSNFKNSRRPSAAPMTKSTLSVYLRRFTWVSDKTSDDKITRDKTTN